MIKVYETSKDYVETFDSIVEFENTIDSRKPSTHFKTFASSKQNGNEGWSGTKSYEDAEKLLRNGYTVGAEKLNNASVKFHSTDSKILNSYQLRMKLSVVGAVPCVPNAVRGYPKAMYRQTKVERPSAKRTLKIVFANVACANTSADDLFKSGATMLNFASFVEKCGIRTEIYISPYMGYKKLGSITKTIGCYVRVKEFNQPFNFQKLAYGIAHVSMFRRQGFNYIETVPTKVSIGFESNHGCQIETSTAKTKLEQAKVLSGNDLFIDYSKVENAGFDVMKLAKNEGIIK